MDEIFKSILKSLGASEETITKIETALKETDEAKKKAFNSKEIVDGLIAHQKRLLENDSDFISKFQSAEKGKFMEQLDRRLKQSFGITNEDLKDKTIEDKITFAKSSFEKNYSASATELQNENIKLKNELKNIQEIEIPKIKGETESFKKSLKIDSAITKIVGENKLRVSADAIIPALKSVLENMYHVDMNETGDLQILTKIDKLGIKNPDGTALLSAKDIIVSKLKEFKAIEESNADDDPNKKKKTVVVSVEKKDDDIHAVGLSAAEKHLSDVKKLSEKKE